MDKHRYIEFQTDGELATVQFKIKDFCNTYDVRACGDELAEACRETQPRDLIVDFEDMGVVPSSVFANLVLIYKRLKESNGRLHICGLGKEALGAFYVLNLQRLMSVHTSADEALDAVRKQHEQEKAEQP